MPVIFFDIGETLANASVDAAGRLVFTVLPGVLSALDALRKRSLRMGIISDRGNFPAETVIRELDASGLLRFFDPNLILFARKNSPEPFARAAGKAGVAPAECFFVGEDKAEGSHALSAGFAEVITNPAHVLDVLDGSRLVFASISRPGVAEPDAESDAWSHSGPSLAPSPPPR